MILPKTLYEILPYTYMSIGVAEIGYFKSYLTTSSGLLFFFAGALIWILRSNYRRFDDFRLFDSKSKLGLYELKPFLLILLGVMFYTWFGSNLTSSFATLTVLVGIYIVFLRAIKRSRQLKFG
ncbi:hypothetical protein Q4575_03080 [Psychrosphaera sp. 1_MG-2023]|uniref:hypothetical protein n=1 Tax=Psychrosphaera sp. 1_MG-2023 TaxID=3062643 RepID=UPI0026E1A1EC|nr:hypothetical protein [Psychrosphaera sp. 1_MG-2023]MDO6718365.1 hypothetical protein [Psychrosphaera sp. 1_MG-2023]